MSTTFVTAYFKIYDEEYHNLKTFENRLKNFMLFLTLDINICIFIDYNFKEEFYQLEQKYKNLKNYKLYEN